MTTEKVLGQKILQRRAAALGEHDHLDSYFSRRPGWPIVRRISVLEVAA